MKSKQGLCSGLRSLGTLLFRRQSGFHLRTSSVCACSMTPHHCLSRGGCWLSLSSAAGHRLQKVSGLHLQCSLTRISELRTPLWPFRVAIKTTGKDRHWVQGPHPNQQGSSHLSYHHELDSGSWDQRPQLKSQSHHWPPQWCDLSEPQKLGRPTVSASQGTVRTEWGIRCEVFWSAELAQIRRFINISCYYDHISIPCKAAENQVSCHKLWENNIYKL